MTFDNLRDEFIDALYGLALEDNFTSAVLPLFADLMGAPSSNVGVMDRVTQNYDHDIFGIDVSALQGGEHYFPLNPWVKAGFVEDAVNGTAYTRPTVRTGSQLVPYNKYCETEFYRDFNRFTGVGDDMLATFFPYERGTVAFAVSVGGRLFNEEDVRRAHSLLKDLERAFHLHLRIATRGVTMGALGHQAGSALAIITMVDDTIRDANAAARVLIETGAPLRITAGRIRFVDNDAQDALQRVRSLSAPPTLACVIQYDQERWLVQFVRRARTRLLDLMRIDKPIISIVISPLNSAAAARRCSIDGFVELTNTEREILTHLINGLDMPAISRISGRGRETVRTHIANLRVKLGARSMLDLARIGALLLPL